MKNLIYIIFFLIVGMSFSQTPTRPQSRVPAAKVETVKPESPPLGYKNFYPKADGEWYAQDDAGNELCISCIPDLNVLIPKSDIATNADIIAKTAEKVLDATRVLDEDDFSSDSNVNVPTQRSVHRYTDRRDPYLSQLGTIRKGMQIRFRDGLTRTVSIDGGTFLDWDPVNHQSSPHNFDAQSILTFSYIMSDGTVPALSTALIADATNTTVFTNLEREENGAIVNVTTNREIAHRVYINSLTSDVKVLLAQHQWNTAAELLQKIQTEDVIVPTELASYQYVGAILVSQGSDNYQDGNNSGILMASEFGSIVGTGGTGSGDGSIYLSVSNDGERDALTNELLAGLVVGVTNSTEGGGGYAEYRVLSPGATWALTTKEKIFPWDELELTSTQLIDITDTTFGLVSGQNIFIRELNRQGVVSHFSATDGNELIPRSWQAKALYDNFGNRIRQGSTADKLALGVVSSSTPFFDTDLGKLQYYKTSSDVFTVNKAATDLPYLIEWASTNSVFSNMQFKITTSATETTDNPTINLPDGQDVLLYIIGRQFFNGIQAANTLGGAFTVRNDNGTLTLVSIEPNRYWGGGLDYTTMAYTDFPNLVTNPIGISISDVNTIFNNIAGAGVWTNLDGTLTQSQALEDFKPNTEYKESNRFVAPMPVNADFISNNGAIVNVDYIFEANTDIPNTIAAFDEAQADSGNYDLVGVFRVSGTQDRVLTGTGIMLLDPIADLSNTDISEYIHLTTTDTPKTIRLVPAPNFVTIWKDYTGTNIVQPTAANEDFVLPADSQIWVHRSGNNVYVTFESNEGGSSNGADFTQVGIPLSATSDKHYVLQYNGTEIVNTLAYEYEKTGGFEFSCNHLTGELIQRKDEPSASGGTVDFVYAFNATPIITATSTQNRGHNISILTKSETQFTFDQWDVINVQQSGTWNWSAEGVKQ